MSGGDKIVTPKSSQTNGVENPYFARFNERRSVVRNSEMPLFYRIYDSLTCSPHTITANVLF